MESKIKQHPITAADSSPPHSKRDSGDHIMLSPPAASPGNSPPGSSYSSPLHSKHNSGEHISLSTPGNSPAARSSFSSDHNPVNHLPENKPPAAVVRRDVFKGTMENTVVLEEPMAVVNVAVLQEPKAVATKIDPGIEVMDGGDGGGIERRRVRPSLSILSRAKRETMVKKAALGFRVFGFLFCLVSLSVMAADRNQGWALDSFNRYKEFRYCISVNVIGFLYSGVQAFDLSYNLATGKYIVHHQQQLRYYFDFGVDQIIAYLLISASSSAAIRIDDWQSNWGKDKFPDMSTASVSMSFLAFVALASNSLISGYALCTSKSI